MRPVVLDDGSSAPPDVEANGEDGSSAPPGGEDAVEGDGDDGADADASAEADAAFASAHVDQVRCESGVRLSVSPAQLESQLEAFVSHGYMAQANAQQYLAAAAADHLRLSEMRPYSWRVTQHHFELIDLVFTWPADVAGQRYRFATCLPDASLDFERELVGEEPVRPQRPAEPRHPADVGYDDSGDEMEYDDLMQADQDFRLRLAVYESDLETFYQQYQQYTSLLSLPADVKASLELNKLEWPRCTVTLRRPCLRTIAEPLGCFECRCDLQPRATLSCDSHDWMAHVSSRVGSLCDAPTEPYHWDPRVERHNQRAQTDKLSEFDRQVVPNHLSEPIRTLLNHPMLFTCDVHVVSTAQRCTQLRVSVGLRPLAFVALAEESSAKVEELRALMRLLYPMPPPITDQRVQPPIAIELDDGERRASKRGLIADRMLSALETFSEVATLPLEADCDASTDPPLKCQLRGFQRRALTWMCKQEDSLPEECVADDANPYTHYRPPAVLAIVHFLAPRARSLAAQPDCRPHRQWGANLVRARHLSPVAAGAGRLSDV